LFLAFGHGHFGMTGGPPSGKLLALLINRKAADIEPAAYSPKRFA
jgi:D-amino-acid dehydrogenase